MGSFVGFVELTDRLIKTTSTNKQRPLGTMGRHARTGRVYAWTLAGEALDLGIPVNPAALGGFGQAGLTVINNSTEDLTSTSRQIVLSTTNSTWGAIKDEYADGDLVIEASTHTNAVGQRVSVKSNTAGSTSTTDSPLTTTVVFADDDLLTYGLDTGATIQVVPSQYFDVIEHDGGSTYLPIIGVPNVDVGDNEYFWLQTWGPCPILNDGTTVYGENVVGSTQSDQGIKPITGGGSTGTSDVVLETNAQRLGIGYMIGPSPGDNDYGLVFLTIRPT